MCITRPVGLKNINILVSTFQNIQNNQFVNVNMEQSDLLTLDRVFELFDDYGSFNLYSRLPENLIFQDSYGLPLPAVIRVAELLEKYGYASVTRKTSVEYYVELTQRGREAKAEGGHFAFVNKSAEKQKNEVDRQDRKDDLEKYDLFIKKWTYKSRYLPYIASFGALMISCLTYFTVLNRKQAEQKVTILKENPTKLPADTTQKLK